MIMPFVVLMALSVVTTTVVSALSAEAADKSQAVNKSDIERMPGRWSRTDASYILELKDISMDGTLKAAYFNPRSINVSRAEWKRNEGRLTLFIELRDTNYPGSNYSLTYDPGSDKLSGTYYQAVQRRTFTVEFIRRK
jgi:uncharacterized protein (DUF2147 family)